MLGRLFGQFDHQHRLELLASTHHPHAAQNTSMVRYRSGSGLEMIPTLFSLLLGVGFERQWPS
jgi:hypothetical protein